ncbi:DUF871 domain-containing protein [Lactococcus formosensis]|uniref:DUF871 domain-containing protein n=1 Tax=Lactococcus formosensis TaxID=1281486 RepID=UPI001BCCBE57|nr:MupG family TIM beta-alpha barrel fold protein [Lactococcus formosensis]
MFGFSIFMNEDLSTEDIHYIKRMKQAGFKGIFTSMHIPEDDAQAYKMRLEKLGACAKANQLELMVDISGEALERAGYSFEHLEELTQHGVTGLRMDYHIDNEQISKASHKMKISLNASTLVEDEVEELRRLGANFSNLEAWHNYYPRPETGLATPYFLEQNQWLEKYGFKRVAFVAGDAQKRLPLRLGLPTLEKHRDMHPLAAALDLFKYETDEVYIGDGDLAAMTIEQFENYMQWDKIVLHVENNNSAYYDSVLGEHDNRNDQSPNLIRSANARFKKVEQIQKEHAEERNKGAVTLDNELYGRYMGETQVCKKALPAHPNINVVAYVIEKDRDLLDVIYSKQKFELKEKERK